MKNNNLLFESLNNIKNLEESQEISDTNLNKDLKMKTQ